MYSDLMLIVVIYNKSISDVFFWNDFINGDYGVDLYIHDNSQESQLIPEISSLVYFHDPRNLGVSYAYNCGIQIAKKKNKKCVILLDQDTNFTLSLLSKYQHAYSLFSDKFIYAPSVCDSTKTKLYSPACLKNFVGHVQVYEKVETEQIYSLYNRSVINSGLMIPVSILDKIGIFNEKIKLDFSDIFFIEKYKKFNKQIIFVPIELIHSLSGDEGYNRSRELNRFKFYCVGARELSLSLHVNTLYTVFRRLIRLIIKYRTFEPLKTIKNYYFGDYSI